MRHDRFLTYTIIVIAQMLICNYLHLSHYVTVSILPVAILCLPSRVESIPAMLIAFATGLAVDLLSDGLTGLNTLALVPVAAMPLTPNGKCDRTALTRML